MSISEKRTVKIPAEHTAFIDAKVASGAYASTSEVVSAGLSALREREETVEHWLRDAVTPAYDAISADPQRGIAAETVFAEIRSRHAERLLDRK